MTAAPFPESSSPDRSSTGEPARSDQPSWQPTPSAPSAGGTHRPPLRRSTTNKVLGGVCGGLAEYTGVDALLWRIGFIALALMGAGILVYPLLWLLVPAGQDAPVIGGVRATLQNGRPPRPDTKT
jgi:phage shock protein PspC (stress-responsive transcriptional regulator)